MKDPARFTPTPPHSSARSQGPAPYVTPQLVKLGHAAAMTTNVMGGAVDTMFLSEDPTAAS